MSAEDPNGNPPNPYDDRDKPGHANSGEDADLNPGEDADLNPGEDVDLKPIKSIERRKRLSNSDAAIYETVLKSSSPRNSRPSSANARRSHPNSRRSSPPSRPCSSNSHRAVTEQNGCSMEEGEQGPSSKRQKMNGDNEDVFEGFTPYDKRAVDGTPSTSRECAAQSNPTNGDDEAVNMETEEENSEEKKDDNKDMEDEGTDEE